MAATICIHSRSECCYIIAQKVCSVTGISKIANDCLKALIEIFKKNGFLLSPERELEIKNVIYKDIESDLFSKCVKKVAEIFQNLLSDFTLAELNEVSEDTLTYNSDSATYMKFYRQHQIFRSQTGLCTALIEEGLDPAIYEKIFPILRASIPEG